ncbi:hypothetical protein EDC04DRAFT_2551161, partial [Pisolithus marmoratus]
HLSSSTCKIKNILHPFRGYGIVFASKSSLIPRLQSDSRQCSLNWRSIRIYAWRSFFAALHNLNNHLVTPRLQSKICKSLLSIFRVHFCTFSALCWCIKRE